MAAVGNDGVAVEKPLGVDGAAERAAQHVDPGAVDGGNADDAVGQNERRSGVGFVDDGEEGLVFAEREIGGGNRPFNGSCVDQMDDDTSAGDACEGAFDAHPFELVVGGADACRVEEPEQHAVDVGLLLDDVARGACDVGDQRPVVAQQAVQQGGFACVGRAYDGNRDAVFYGVPGGE